jgi:hypothetical protein
VSHRSHGNCAEEVLDLAETAYPFSLAHNWVTVTRLDDKIPTPDVLLAEYRAASDELATAASRIWQSTGILAAAFVTAGVGMGTVLPSSFFPEAFKITIIWVASFVVLAVLIYWVILVVHERAAQAVSVQRLVDIELALEMRKTLNTCFLNDWAKRKTFKEWDKIGQSDRTHLEELVSEHLLVPRPFWALRYGPYFLRHERLHPLFAALLVAPVVMIVGLASFATAVVLNS